MFARDKRKERDGVDFFKQILEKLAESKINAVWKTITNTTSCLLPSHVYTGVDIIEI